MVILIISIALIVGALPAGYLINELLWKREVKKEARKPVKKPGYRVYWKDATREFTLGVYADPTEAKSIAEAYAGIIRPGESPENSDIHICYDQDSPPFYFHREYPENEFL